MKLTKALYFIAFLLAINVLVPGSNNYVEAKPADGNSLANKIKNNKAAFIATLITTLAVAAAGTTFGVMHLKKKKGDSKKKPVLSDMNTTPLISLEKKPVPGSNNKIKPSTSVPTSRASSPLGH